MGRSVPGIVPASCQKVASRARDKDTYTETLDARRSKRSPFKPSALTLIATTRLPCILGIYARGHTVWAHFRAHTARFSLGLFRKREENGTRRRFP
jgi:hypothetical protein